MSKNTTNYSMKAFIISLIIVLSVSGFAQNKSALSTEAKMLLDTYYPGNNALHKKVNDIENPKQTRNTEVTNNTMFVGSTADLQKMLKKQKEINNIEST